MHVVVLKASPPTTQHTTHTTHTTTTTADKTDDNKRKTDDRQKTDDTQTRQTEEVINVQAHCDGASHGIFLFRSKPIGGDYKLRRCFVGT